MNTHETFSLHILANSRVRHRKALTKSLLTGEVSAADCIHKQSLQRRFGIEAVDQGCHLTEVEHQLTHEAAIRFVTLGSHGYPPGLLDLPSPPYCLRVAGSLPLTPGITIVGARAAQLKHMTRAHNLGATIAMRHSYVISGGAYGVDGAAHRGALEGGGATLVCLGSGLLRPYPGRHIPLFRTIITGGGGVMSALHLEAVPYPGAFIGRNAIMAALSRGVVVVAAGSKSGSLYTANYAKKLNRPLFAFPGSPGCETIIREGAVALHHEMSPEAFMDMLSRTT